MGRLFTSSFGLNSTTNAHEWDTFNLAGGLTIQNTVAHSPGGYALKITTPTATSNARFQWASANQQGVFYFLDYILLEANATGSPRILNISDQGSADILRIRMAVNKLRATDVLGTQVGSDSAALSLNVWYRVEIKIDTTTLATTAVTVLINGDVAITGTLSAAAGIARILVGSSDTDATMIVYHADLAINDSTGTVQNSYCGEQYVKYLSPDAAGDVNTFATQTGGTAGAGNNFTRVNEQVPDDATTFNGSSTLNQEDLFNFGASGLKVQDVITVIQVWGRFRNSTADPTAAIKFEIEKTGSGTITQSAAIVPNSTAYATNAVNSPRNPFLTLYVDPDGAFWTQITVDTLQGGYKLTVAPGTAGRRIDVTKLWVTVSYWPATGSQLPMMGLM